MTGLSRLLRFNKVFTLFITISTFIFTRPLYVLIFCAEREQLMPVFRLRTRRTGSLCTFFIELVECAHAKLGLLGVAMQRQPAFMLLYLRSQQTATGCISGVCRLRRRANLRGNVSRHSKVTPWTVYDIT